MSEHSLEQRRVHLLAAGARVARSAATILDPGELLQRVVDIICEEFGFYYAGVFLVDEAGEWAELQAGRGQAGRLMLAEKHRLKIGGNSMIGMATYLHQARIALDVGDEPYHFKNPHLPDTRSEMALPLLVGESLIGALTVQSTQGAAFSNEDISALQTMADQLAVAIRNAQAYQQNAQLLQQSERRARLLAAAHAASARLTSILDLDELLPQTVDVICQAFGFYYAGVFLLDESGEWAVLRAGYGAAGSAMLQAGHRLKVGGHSMIGAATGLRQARIALDVGDEAVHFKNPYLPHTRSEMALPLLAAGTVLGAVTVQSVEAAAFSEEDISTLQAMADGLTIAIHNAQLLRQLELANAELLRTKTYEALYAATNEAVHWIGNKAMPVTSTLARLRQELLGGALDVESLREDLQLIEDSITQIVEVKENLIGSVRERMPRPLLLADVWQAAAGERGVPAGALVTQTAPDAPLALGDSTLLVRAFGNLLQNSLEAGAQSLRVEIGPAEQPGFIVARLVDDGAGIPEEIQDQIWTAFFTTKGVRHHGLGLPAAQQAVIQLGGRIELESQDGPGAVFAILLPTSQPGEAAMASPIRPGLKVALVDDPDDWAAFAAQAIQDAGGVVSRCATPAEIDSLSREIDLVLLDSGLQSATLVQAIQSLRQAGLLDKTILVTPATTVELVTGYLQRGLRDVALKPYNLAELAELLQ